MMNNDSALQLSNVLNRECTRSGALPEQACSGNHQRTGRQTVKFAAAGGVRSDPHPRKMGSTGIGNGIAIPHGKLEEDTLRAVGVLSSWKPHRLRRDRQSTCRPAVRAAGAGRPDKTHLHTLSRWPNGWRTKRFVVACARRRAMKSCEIITEAGSSDDA